MRIQRTTAKGTTYQATVVKPSQRQTISALDAIADAAADLLKREKPTVISCGALGGRSPLTGKRVGSRHRWSGATWGMGTCDFCHRTLEEVTTK